MEIDSLSPLDDILRKSSLSGSRDADYGNQDSVIYRAREKIYRELDLEIFMLLQGWGVGGG